MCANDAQAAMCKTSVQMIASVLCVKQMCANDGISIMCKKMCANDGISIMCKNKCVQMMTLVSMRVQIKTFSNIDYLITSAPHD